MGFEPTEGCPSHAFQACRFGRSRIPPGRGDRTCTLTLFDEGGHAGGAPPRWFARNVDGSGATGSREPSQVRKEAALSGSSRVPPGRLVTARASHLGGGGFLVGLASSPSATRAGVGEVACSLRSRLAGDQTGPSRRERTSEAGGSVEPWRRSRCTANTVRSGSARSSASSTSSPPCATRSVRVASATRTCSPAPAAPARPPRPACSPRRSTASTSSPTPSRAASARTASRSRRARSSTSRSSTRRRTTVSTTCAISCRASTSGSPGRRSARSTSSTRSTCSARRPPTRC